MEKIAPEKYSAILDGIELKNILISNIKADVKHAQLSEGMSISIRDNATYEMQEDEFVVHDKYRISAKNSEKKVVLKIECTFVVVFSSSSKITDDFFEIYKEISLPLNVWPFFRELVNSTTARMNIPPLTLPLFKRG